MNSRDRVPVLRLVALAALALPALAAFTPQEADLPQGENELLQWARSHHTFEKWRDAERGYRRFIERFPESSSIDEAHLSLANLYHYYARRLADARDVLVQFIARYPKHEQVWNARYELSNIYDALHQRDEAKKVLREIMAGAPDPSVRSNAVHRLLALDDKYFRLYVTQSFTAGQEAAAQLHLSNVDSVLFRAYRVGFEPLVRAIEAGRFTDLSSAVAAITPADRTLIKEWTEKFDTREWISRSVSFGAKEPGLYFLEGRHDSIVMSVSLFVTRAGLIMKAAEGALLVFAQDRATGKPVPDMDVRVLNTEHPLRGKTDAQGLYRVDGYRGGTVVGLKDGELVTCTSWYEGGDGVEETAYILTDRPIYRPNDTVRFKLVHRQERERRYRVEEGKRLVVAIRDPKGSTLYKATHTLNEFGSTSGSFVLGDEPALGSYYVLAAAEGSVAPENGGWWSSWNAEFRVDEYRKPEYKVAVAFGEPRYLQGDSVTATLQADYYFGSPVADADVSYTVYRRPHWNGWRCWDFYYDWYADEEDDGDYGRWWGYGETVAQGTGKTDASGRLAIAFETKKFDHDSVYSVVATVTDLSRRATEGQGSVKATRAEFGLAAHAGKYVYKPGEKVSIRIRAALHDDTPVANTAVTVRASRTWWADNRSHEKALEEKTAVTDAHGIAEVEFTPARDGYLRVRAVASDRRKNEVSVDAWIWIAGDSWGGDYYNFNGLEILPDRKTYEPGETASVLITSQYKDLSVLVTLEGKSIYRHEVVEIKGHTKLYEVKLDRAEFVPNVYVTVTALRDNLLLQKAKSLVVNPAERFVTVAVTPDQPIYRPRDTARYTIETRDAQGRPVSAELAFGIVDESIYALQPEFAADIRKHFVRKIPLQVATQTSLQQYDWGQADALKALPAPEAPALAGAAREFDAAEKGAKRKDGAKGDSSFAATEVRSQFADTMLWLAHVKTDESGRAVVDVPVPDNLTTWRATARAVTRDSRFGEAKASVLSRKAVIVRLETPRFFTQHDETLISVVAHNYLASAKEFTVQLEARGLDVSGALEATARIEAAGQKRFDWKVKAARPGEAQLTVKLLSDEESDAMQLTLPVHAHGTMKWHSLAGLVEGRVAEQIVLPADAVEGAGDLTIILSPTHASAVVDALDYLAGYPYGCVEQTMSRFLPCVVVSQAIQKLGLEKPAITRELPKMVAQGLQRLYTFQQADGGWGWWQHDASTPPTTAYVMIGLALARSADHAVDPQVFARGVAALKQQFYAGTNDTLRAYILYALAACGENTDREIATILKQRAGVNEPYALALLALALHARGRAEEAKACVGRLAAQAESGGAFAWWKGGGRYGWFDHDQEITAAALRALLAVDPKHPLIPRVVTWLAAGREGNHWTSTKQTALVVQALCEYLAVSGDLAPDMTLTLTVNGERILRERVTKDTWQRFDGTRTIPAAKLRSGVNEIVIEKEGTGTPIYSAYLKTYTAEENIAASKGGIRVQRQYARVAQEGGKRVLRPLAGGDTVRSGDEIEVTLRVTADRKYDYLMIDDPLPSGFEPLREDWRHGWHYWYANKEFRDERVSIAVTHLGAGQHTIQYSMRAETPGEFHVLPTRAWNMYHPQIGGNSDEMRIRVVDAE